ncbi:hypothetical protein G7085_15205 [Tessaracoccus sp. HDW20]|uniref:hypothetical protein n=1 Tax=Tessaracoccus coleopterorum TaxID=2714950 RepID=UPI0018D2D559|nr:hypothetical protein [Tessaracoccus coleopterorum]NHB85507.1 hypothetical protein [Tessaracoccus coleopterorum]
MEPAPGPLWPGMLERRQPRVSLPDLPSPAVDGDGEVAYEVLEVGLMTGSPSRIAGPPGSRTTSPVTSTRSDPAATIPPAKATRRPSGR